MHGMDEQTRDMVLAVTGAETIKDVQLVQNLWSGYGAILRCYLDGGSHASVIVKHVQWGAKDGAGSQHPRGWNTSISHQRKLHSYQVEGNWYQHWAERCVTARVPRCLHREHTDDGLLFILEDLNCAGYSVRRSQARDHEITQCLQWLARFHAQWLGVHPQDGEKSVWEQGCYWHLATRPDELAALDDERLRKAAPLIDQELRQCPWQTLVHGDAKLANFCFHENGEEVAAVDFQYIGGGCGIQDVAYFISSCYYDDECAQHERRLLDIYGAALHEALQKTTYAGSADDIVASWRALYPVAWADFYRFLQGWSPGHPKMHPYSEALTRGVVDRVLG